MELRCVAKGDASCSTTVQGTMCVPGQRIQRKKKLTSQNAASGPDAPKSSHESIATVGSHGSLDDLEGLTQGGDLEHVETGAQEQVGKLDGLLLERLRSRAGRGGGDGVGDHDCLAIFVMGALTKGIGCFFAKRV